MEKASGAMRLRVAAGKFLSLTPRIHSSLDDGGIRVVRERNSPARPREPGPKLDFSISKCAKKSVKNGQKDKIKTSAKV